MSPSSAREMSRSTSRGCCSPLLLPSQNTTSPRSCSTSFVVPAVRHVSIFGRRGSLQAAFTTKKSRKLTSLDGTSMLPLAHQVLVARLLLLAHGPRHRARQPTARTNDRAVPTGVTSVQHTELGLRRGVRRSGARPPAHQVLDVAGRALRRVYAPGWAATGARGVLASTMLDAYAVADTILADYDDGASDAREAPAAEYSEDTFIPNDDVVDLDSLPGEVKAGVSTRRVVQ